MSLPLTSKRLLIRYALPTDAEALMKIQNSAFVLKYNPMHPVTLQQMEQTLKESNGQTLCLWEKEKNCVIGAIFLEKDELRFGVSSCMISYYLNEIYAQKGYMTEALQSLIPFLFASGYAVISARVFADNIASAKLLQKAGFLKEGLLRHAVNDGKGKIHDDFLFSMVKEG